MELDESISDEILNRRQSVSFKTPASASATDLSSLDEGQGDFDEVTQTTFSLKDEVIDMTTTTYSDEVDPSIRRHSSQFSTSDISFALQLDNILIGLSIVYAIVMSIVGLVIPISEALTHSWLNTIYGAAFLTYQLTVGFCFLVYLQFFHLIKSKSCQTTNSHDDVSAGKRRNDSVRSKGVSATSRRQSIGRSTIWVDMTSFGDIFTHPETSLFLRIGTLVFSLGNLIYYAFEIAGYMCMNEACKSKTRFGWTFYLRFAFVLFQTYFLFKNVGVSLNKHIHGVWFGMLHLASTNICLWFRTVVYEILEEVALLNSNDHGPGSGSGPGHGPDPYGVTDTSLQEDFASNHSTPADCEDELLPTLTIYLFPFILEYSLIAVGTITSLLQVMVVTRNDQGNRIQRICNTFRAVALRKGTTDAEEEKPSSDTGQPDILGKSHRGFFISALVVAGTVAVIILFFLIPQKKADSFLPSIIYYAGDMCLHVFLLGGCVLGFIQMRPLGFLPKTLSTDDVLIVVAMCGSVIYELAAIIASSDALNHKLPDKRIEVLRLSSSLVSFVQAIAQALFLLCSLRRYPSDTDHVEKMPGRGAITTLVIGNATLWVFRTILAKGSDMTTQEQFFGEVPWLMLMDINLPLSLFFCFHSAICFADVWHNAYAPLQCDGQISRSSSMSNVIVSRSASCNRIQTDTETTKNSRAIFWVS